MGKFFANQLKDEAGVVGITLQKLLIFFMVLDGIAMIFGFSFFASLLSLLFHFAVFMGVYRRRTCVLLIYVVLNVITFVLAAFVLLLLASSMMYVDTDYDSSYDSSSSYSHEHIKNHTYAPKIVNDFLNAWHPTNNNSTASASASASSDSSSNSFFGSYSSDSYNFDGSSSYEVSSDMLLISLLALVLSVGLLYCKILSVVLAHRMRRILLTAPALPVSQPQSNNVNTDANDQSTDTTPFLHPEDNGAHPFFTQPGFLPYPPMQSYYPGQNGAMMPAPFMYGQHPVFYTFAPMQQQPPANEDEKL